MKKFFFCISLSVMGLMTACVDKDVAVDADSKPDWLGGSIYQELKEPQFLTGTFSTYLRLIDDAGMANDLNRTGSMTVFPANDEAFERFFRSNDWGVSKYEDLSAAQKKMLLSNSMLNNAMLLGMLSNVNNSTTQVEKGIAVKHETNSDVIDSIQIVTEADIPVGTPYWDYFKKNGGKYLVSDSTNSMMIHFTREHMLHNNITTLGENSDFAILMGKPYQEGMAYVFDKEVVKGDVTCQNGYIHQVADVIFPPGNMPEVLRNDAETSYFSRILDYFSGAYVDQNTTRAYNSYALEHGMPTVDAIYERRYLSKAKYGKGKTVTPDGTIISADKGVFLEYDPGWNQFSPQKKDGSGIDYSLADIGAMFVPTNEAVKNFFVHGGKGAEMIDMYGKYKGTENNEAHLLENLDSLFANRPDILCEFVNNIMRPSFVETVPSKFDYIQNDVSDYMGIVLDSIHKRTDGRYDIKIANNGVIYKMDKFYSPAVYESVMGPTSIYPDMSVMKWAVTDNTNLGVSFHYYLKAMKSRFAFFIPDDAAFEKYYIDPIYLGHPQPRVLKFTPTANGGITCVAYAYDPETNTVGNVMYNGANRPLDEWKSLFIDILNFHTVVLQDGENLGDNKYYKTKHGGEILLSGIGTGSMVMSGQQIDNGVETSEMTEVFHKQNGTAFRVNHIIEGPRNSVSKMLQAYNFNEFYALCAGFGAATEEMRWAGISDEVNSFGTTEQDSYMIFSSSRRVGKSVINGCCLDENVKMFNTYNYTLYAPNDAAMEAAYANGLPRWETIHQIYEDNMEKGDDEPGVQEAKDRVKAMIGQLKKFARYHFQSTSVYADNKVSSAEYDTFSSNDMGVALKLVVNGGSGKINVTDEAGKTHSVTAGSSSNLMARDYWFNSEKSTASSIYTSSFCVIHELTDVLSPWKSTDKDCPWIAGSRR